MHRLVNILANTIRSVIGPLFTVLLSLVVIRYSNRHVWGHFVEFMIVIGLLNQFLNWGHREYLLRSFSQTPAKINSLFLANFLSRSSALIGLLLLLPFFFTDLVTAGWVTTWLVFSFSYQSMEVLIVYKKSFNVQIIAESSGFMLTLAGLFIFPSTSMEFMDVLQWYTLGIVVKCLIAVFFMRKELRVKKIPTPDWSFFREGFPFFLVGFSGMLFSKSDLYVVGVLLEAEALGTYQVIITFFIYLQALAGFAVTPFIRQLYRMPVKGYHLFMNRFRKYGTVVCLVASPIIYLVLNHGYHFNLSWDYLVYGFLMAWPVFFYLPMILVLYKKGHEKEVVWVNFAATAVNVVLTVSLIQGFGLKGALLGTVIVHWLLVIYYLSSKRRKNKQTDKSESEYLKFNESL